jgi:hypothetical protein
MAMSKIRCIILVALMTTLPVFGAAEHSPLMPRPQQVQYGTGQLPLDGLSIRFTSTPGSEDWFAAQELSSVLSSRAGTRIPISEGTSSGRAIVLNRTGAVETLPVPGERSGPDSREAYSIKVTREGAEVRARSSAGLYYGVQTLGQLCEGTGEQAALPAVEVHDWPALAYRGVMVDMSHGPLPTEEEVERQIDFLARWKGNQYYFYSEASIELQGYSLLNPGGRFTQEQVRRIVEYARARHVDVVPCLELYGHLHDVFRVERYSDLAPFPHGGEFNPRNPKVMVMLADWAEQLSRLFPSPFVHIGFDETWQIEKAARQQGTGATPAKLFVEQLKNVSRLFEQRGKRVMAWGDIIVKYPGVLSDLPPGLIAVAWYYDPDPDYKERLGPLAANHVPHFIASGVNSWNEVAPDFDRAFANIDTFLAAGRRSNTLGLMNTVWTDDAQILLRMSWPAIAYGAAASWQSAAMDRARFFSDFARLMYPEAVAPEAASALEKLAKAEVSLQKVLGQDTMLALWDDPFAPANLKRSAERRDDLRQTRLLAEEAQEHLDRALALGADPTTLNSLLFGARLLDFAGWKFLTALEIAERWQQLGPRPTGDQWWNDFESDNVYQSHSRLADMMDTITELREVFRSLWLAEYTPYRLASALGRFDAEYEYWRQIQARFQAFSRTYHEGEALPPLESFTKPH